MNTKRGEKVAFDELCTKVEGYVTLDMTMTRFGDRKTITYRAYSAQKGFGEFCDTPGEAVVSVLSKADRPPQQPVEPEREGE